MKYKNQSFYQGFYRFFHCPSKNSFCHGKNPTLLCYFCQVNKFIHSFIHTSRYNSRAYQADAS